MGFLDEQIEKVERKRRRRQWYPIIGGILIVILLVGVYTAFNLYSREVNIVVIPVEGDLHTGTGVGGSEDIGQELINAADDGWVEGIVLRVNSPGGSPAAAQEIVQDLQYARTRKPVVVSMGDMATSAAYYVSAYADRIYANPDTITGGLGTIWVFTDISSWMKQEGYTVTVVKSGENKDMTYPYRTLSPEEERYAQDLVNRSFERFIIDVTSQRNISRSSVESALLYRGEEAISLGMVDELGNLHAAMEGARTLAAQR